MVGGKFRALGAGVIILALLLVGLVFNNRRQQLLNSSEAINSRPPITKPLDHPSHAPSSTTKPLVTPDTASEPPRKIKSLTKLVAAGSAIEAKEAWHAAKKELLSLPNGAEALSALTAALDGGENRRYSSAFRVANGGELLEAPSLRVYLLDLLAQIDNLEAARYARSLLNSSSDSDEWAIALRNYSWGTDNAASDAFLRSKVRELVTNQTWINSPSSGFLEAFDFVPYTQDPELVAPLTSLTHRESSDLARRAAFLAISRFVSNDSSSGLRAVSSAELGRSFSPIRADTMARADFTRAEDVVSVREYLLDQSIEPGEFAIFAQNFPHGGQFAGSSLATTFQPISFSELARRDAQALATIKEWLSDPAFAPRQAELSRVYQKLKRLTASASKI